MYEKYLADIVTASDLSQSEVAKRAGVSSAYLSMCLNGKTHMTERVWVNLLMNVLNMNENEAHVQLAKWQIEEAKENIAEARGVVVQGNHNEVSIGRNDEEILQEVSKLDENSKKMILSLIKEMKKKK